MKNKTKRILVFTFAPIWFPHWPAWMWTISLILMFYDFSTLKERKKKFVVVDVVVDVVDSASLIRLSADFETLIADKVSNAHARANEHSNKPDLDWERKTKAEREKTHKETKNKNAVIGRRKKMKRIKQDYESACSRLGRLKNDRSK